MNLLHGTAELGLGLEAGSWRDGFSPQACPQGSIQAHTERKERMLCSANERGSKRGPRHSQPKSPGNGSRGPGYQRTFQFLEIFVFGEAWRLPLRTATKTAAPESPALQAPQIKLIKCFRATSRLHESSESAGGGTFKTPLLNLTEQWPFPIFHLQLNIF